MQRDCLCAYVVCVCVRVRVRVRVRACSSVVVSDASIHNQYIINTMPYLRP